MGKRAQRVKEWKAKRGEESKSRGGVKEEKWRNVRVHRVAKRATDTYTAKRKQDFPRWLFLLLSSFEEETRERARGRTLATTEFCLPSFRHCFRGRVFLMKSC